MNLLKVKEVSKMLGVTDATVRNFVKNRSIPAYTFGSVYRFDEDEVRQWIADRRLEVKNSNVEDSE